MLTESRSGLAADYAIALEHYLAHRDEAALVRAHELGRQALTDGLGVLEMASLHSGALAEMLKQPLSTDQRVQVLDAVEKFFLESLSAFEMAHRGFWETNKVLHRLNDVLEAQAKRIAAQLHDESAQMLASVHFTLAEVARRIPADDANAIQIARTMLDQIEQRLRRLAHELRPPILDDLGLVPALEFLAETTTKRWGLPVGIDVSLTRPLPATVEAILYRITQEALTNAAKHANAGHASVTVTQAAHSIALSVCDDGTGFDVGALAPGKRGMGLIEIQERVNALGGVLRFGPHTRGGTNLTVEIPLES
jgi:signal transduction histidine kinase